MTYVLLKSAHIFFVVAWMVGLLYLPRLLVYHAEATPGGEHSETLKTMERRLLKGIMTPSMIVTWVLGIWLATHIAVWDQGWLAAKMAIVLLLTILHFWLAGRVRRFASDTNETSARTYRVVNEAPAVALIAILLLVVGKFF